MNWRNEKKTYCYDPSEKNSLLSEISQKKEGETVDESFNADFQNMKKFSHRNQKKTFHGWLNSVDELVGWENWDH